MPDAFATFDIALAIPAPYIPDQEKAPRGGRVLLPETMSEVDVFSLLIWKFNRPNGIMTMLGRDPRGDSEALFKWDFSFKTPDGLEVWIQRTWAHLEVFTQGRRVQDEDILAFFGFNLDRYAGLVAAIRSDLELHKLVINPYVRHKRMAEHAFKELSEAVVPPIWYPPTGMICSAEEVTRHTDSQRSHLTAADHESFMSVVLVSESAFMIEALINLILAFTMKDVVRSSKPVFDETLRRGWKSKIQHLAVTCDHVPKTPDLGDDRIRKASKVFELRNRIAHAYPDPANLSVGRIYFLQRFPVLDHPVPFDGFQMNSDRLLPSRAEALEAYENATEMRGYLLEQLAPWHREEMENIIDASPLGFNTKTERFSIVFAGRGIEKVFVSTGDEPEPEADLTSRDTPGS